MNQEKIEAAEMLEGAADLWECGAMGWAQRYYAKNSYGHGVSLSDRDACSFCSMGALASMAGNFPYMLTHNTPGLDLRGYMALEALTDLVRPNTVPGWNDKPGRTVEDVIELFRTAAQDLREEAAL